MAKINQLPYYQINNVKETNIIARYLLKKIKKLLEEKFPFHYLIFAQRNKQLKELRKLSIKHPYFLKIDIEKYYPSINHKILLNILEKDIFKNNLSRRLRHIIKKELSLFLRQTSVNNYSLPLGNYLGWVLAGLYLLPLDLKIPQPFLRIQDDYLIFCKNKKEPEKILKEVIEPELDKLELKISINKLNSGRFHQNPVEFIGSKYYAGLFSISEKKIEGFKGKIQKITHLTKKKTEKAIIKGLNNKILGFGHYYKFACCKQDFENLDAFIRQRLRRYLIKNKDQKQKIGNLLLTNSRLKILGLKSLTEIKEKYARKKRHILRKTSKKRGKISNEKKSDFFAKSDFWPDSYWQKAVLQQLQEITKKLTKLERKMTKIEKQMEKL